MHINQLGQLFESLLSCTSKSWQGIGWLSELQQHSAMRHDLKFAVPGTLAHLLIM